jgi:hypothetical protein
LEVGLIISSIRGVGVFVLGLLIAVMGTAVAEFPIYRVTRPQMPGMLRMSYLLDTTIAFGLGYSSSSVSSYAPVSAIVGNNINTFLFGGTADAGGSMASYAPTIVSSAMGSATTFGRRTTNIMSLNLLSTPGGPPLALSQASGSARALLGKVGSALSLGMKFTTKLAVDAAFTGAEAINCSIPP